MIIGCEHVALAQHDRDVSPHTVTIKGFGGRSAPKRHNTPEAVDLARQAFELGHGVEDLLSLAGPLRIIRRAIPLLGPRSMRLGI